MHNNAHDTKPTYVDWYQQHIDTIKSNDLAYGYDLDDGNRILYLDRMVYHKLFDTHLNEDGDNYTTTVRLYLRNLNHHTGGLSIVKECMKYYRSYLKRVGGNK